ncbi:MAG: two pore domain potassium channel family protein [Muribaculaceae bacterium]|nr:two pore domain potassium channel family protein [Muribaculaceae bacterium]
MKGFFLDVGHRGEGVRWRRVVLAAAHWIVLVLSVLLIVFISYDTFRNIPFLESRSYMSFQFMVCVVFVLDFFVELALTPRGDRRRYLRGRWIYLFLSVPYLNIIDGLNLQLGEEALYFVRFIPLARGGLALVIVLGYISSNRITGIFVSYLSILLLCTYFAALIFYEREMPVNARITDYWSAFLWCCLQTTTLGSSIAPVTVAGKVISVILSFMGVMMYPLFTVYLSSLILKSRSVLNVLNIAGLNVKKSGTGNENGYAGVPGVAISDKK